MTAVPTQAARLVRDTFFVTVGFGVLAVQRLQVQRRELERSLDRLLSRQHS